ncbi:hypothetical protein F0P96_16720 [Hymenobacter busanensis]|uniref:Uncharacterized protein n=1 Tax=Hymenobacter busanensis TaxID=2607656 RepID=A0A7L4ZSH6_9BACT|nr:PPC domain-containing protein [Hymenobacter busanensis]KAA9327620.1 hypothetical protein F0P96_16720 [Hymenobacter busanensis]QHJ06041.1 hypothetical protein GUY19_01515 [Hymenobacter busanensis]
MKHAYFTRLQVTVLSTGALLLLLFANGCKKSFDDYIFEGIFSDYDGLTVELKEEDGPKGWPSAKITKLSKVPCTWCKVGEPYITDIKRVNESAWSGKVHKDFTSNTLVPATIRVSATAMYINPEGLSERFFAPPSSNWPGGTTTSGSTTSSTTSGSTTSGSTTSGTTSGSTTSGTTSGSTTSGTTSLTLLDVVVSGNDYELKGYSFTVPTGAKTLTVTTLESSAAYRNTADLFVRRGSAPVVVGPKPPTYTPAYSWTADCAGIKPNREDEVCSFTNPSSGTWYASLYGYNTYFSSRLLVTYTK